MSQSELELNLWVFYLNRKLLSPQFPDLTVLQAWMPVPGASPPTVQPRAGNSPAVGTTSSSFSSRASRLGREIMWSLPLEGPRLVDASPS